MTPQLESALAALAACLTAADVAALLARHVCRGRRALACGCPVATYLRMVGGDRRPVVSPCMAEVNDGGFWVPPPAVADFIRAFDGGAFAELRAA